MCRSRLEDHVTAPRIAEKLVNWFSDVKLASLELPSTSFGAGRNLHALTGAVQLGRKLVVVLDDQLSLVFTDPEETIAGEDQFTIAGYRQVVFDWQEFGNLTCHTDVFANGAVSFRAQRRL